MQIYAMFMEFKIITSTKYKWEMDTNIFYEKIK